MTESIPQQPPLGDLYHVSVGDQIKRLPWMQIGLTVSAVALVTIGGLAHFHVLHQVGSLSSSAIQSLALKGAVTVGMAQLVKASIPKRAPGIIELEAEDYEHTNTQAGYTIKGRFPKPLQYQLNEAIEEALDSAKERGISVEEAVWRAVDDLFIGDGNISVTVGMDTFTGVYEDGQRKR